ncbi:MAG: hypothetical protein PHF84_01615 [bacterium]|nr:hypothetical protein [bacterium]
MKKFLYVILILSVSVQLKASLLNDFQHFNITSYGAAGAVLAKENDINNLEIAPASLADIQGMSLGLSYIRWLDLANLFHLAFGWNIKGAGVFGLSLNGAGIEMDNFSEAGIYLGKIRNNEYQVSAAWAATWKGFRIGVDLKYLSITVDQYSGSWMGAGFSLLYSLAIPGIRTAGSEKNLSLAAGLQDLPLSDPTLVEESSSFSPLMVSGLDYYFLRMDPVNVHFLSGILLALENGPDTLSLGLTVDYNEFIFLRAGLYPAGRELCPFTAGAGVSKILDKGKLLRIDYAFIPSGEEINHCLAAKIDF